MSPPKHRSHLHAHDVTHHDPKHRAQVLDDPARDAAQKPEQVVAALAITPGMVVADVGAGTGYFVSHLSRAVGAEGKVIALDVDAELVAHMQRRFARAQPGNIEVRLVSPADLGLTPNSVDRIVLVDVWHHLNDRVAYARRLAHALAKGGRLVLVDHLPEAPVGPPPELRVSPHAVVAELGAAGFEPRVVVATLPNQFIVVGALL